MKNIFNNAYKFLFIYNHQGGEVVKTIAVDEETWKRIKTLKDKFEARSYDEVIKKLIETWHLLELDKKVDNVILSEEEAEMMLTLLADKKEIKK